MIGQIILAERKKNFCGNLKWVVSTKCIANGEGALTRTVVRTEECDVGITAVCVQGYRAEDLTDYTMCHDAVVRQHSFHFMA